MQIDNEYMRLTDVAKFLAVEGATPLASEEILSRLWAAFWRGEFEEETGTNQMNVSVFILMPGGQVGTVTSERIYCHRKGLFWILKTMAGLSVEPIQGDQHGQVKIDGVYQYPDPGKEAFEALILNWDFHCKKMDQAMKEVYIDNAMIEREGFLAWCTHKKYKHPSFWVDTAPQPEKAQHQEDSTNTEEKPRQTAKKGPGRHENVDYTAIEAEMRRRAEAGEMLMMLKAETCQLETWAKGWAEKQNPPCKSSAAGNIEKHFRELYRTLKSAEIEKQKAD